MQFVPLYFAASLVGFEKLNWKHLSVRKASVNSSILYQFITRAEKTSPRPIVNTMRVQHNFRKYSPCIAQVLVLVLVKNNIIS